MELDRKSKGELLFRWKQGSLTRWVGMGGREDEIFEASSKVNDLDDWCPEFSKIGQRFEREGDSAQESSVKASNYRAAAVYYHIGQLGIFEDNQEKKEAFFASVRAYEKGAKHYFRPIEVVRYPYDGVMLKAYFRKNPEVKNAPCVIIIKGADASSEGEVHVISTYFVNRGLTVLDVDVQGQCYARWQGLRMTPEFEKSVGAALDYLKTRPDVDMNKVGIYGVCVGGFIAPRAAAFDKRLKACVSVGGFYALDEFEYPLTAVLNLQNDMMITPVQWPEEKKKYTLKGLIEKVTCPLLVVNGSEDRTLPVSQCVKIYENARCPKDLRIYQGYGHNVYNENRYALVGIADWLWDKLQA